MKISKTYQLFADKLGKPEALQNPQDFLGPNYRTVLNFWIWLDTLTPKQLKTVGERYYAFNAAFNAAGVAAGVAARNAAGDVARSAASAAAFYTAWDAAGSAAACATCELMGSHILLEKGKTLFFVPMFDFKIDFSKIRPKTVLISTPTANDFLPNYLSGRSQLLSVPGITGQIFPIRNLCLEIEMPQE